MRRRERIPLSGDECDAFSARHIIRWARGEVAAIKRRYRRRVRRQVRQDLAPWRREGTAE